MIITKKKNTLPRTGSFSYRTKNRKWNLSNSNPVIPRNRPLPKEPQTNGNNENIENKEINESEKIEDNFLNIRPLPDPPKNNEEK